MKMSGADLNVIKDIPGYKLILKTVLKSQIQQLVEQLADQTGEESILLTVSVTDGSLSHLGSESAKDFIDNHDDIKSQFLGFIIKKHHQQIEIDRGQQNLSYTDNQNISSALVQSGPGPRPNLSPAYRNSFNDNSQPVSSVHPVSLSKVSPKGRGRGRGGFRGRAVPYSNPSRKPFKNNTIKRTATSTPKQHSESDSVIRAYQDNVPAIDLSAEDDFKIESVEVLEEVENISDSSQQGNSRKRSRRNSSQGSVVGSNSSSEPVPSSLTVASDDQITDTVNLGISKTEGVETSDENVHQEFENSHTDSEFDPSLRVKVEAGEESGMDLGITGVHPGYAAPSEDSWVHHVQSGMDLSAIAGTSQGDMMGNFNPSTKNENKAPKDLHVPLTDRPGERGRQLPGKKFECHICSRKYKSRDTLSKHIKKHTDAFICRRCTQVFKDAESLRHHKEMKHEQEFLCATCGKTLIGRQSYINHLTIHEGKPLKCTYESCGKSFFRQKELDDHLNVHSGLKPYKCGTCTTRFARSASLSKHKVTCGLGKLVCPTCKKEYKCQSSLADHQHTEHDMTVFACSCGKTFRWRANLSRHQKQCGQKLAI